MTAKKFSLGKKPAIALSITPKIDTTMPVSRLWLQRENL